MAAAITAFSGAITINPSFSISAQQDLLAANAPINSVYQLLFNGGLGAGANQLQILFSDQRTIAPSGTDDLDLNGATLLDPFGNALAFTKVKAVLVFAAAANTNNVIIGNAAATQFVGWFGAATHTISLPPGGFCLIGRTDATGWACAGGATDLLRLTNSAAGTSVTYDILVLGA
jgi:hypothetical protein